MVNAFCTDSRKVLNSMISQAGRQKFTEEELKEERSSEKE
jgi:hypothetical protein